MVRIEWKSMMIPMVVVLALVLLPAEIGGQIVYPGSWKLLLKNGGVSAMHMATTYRNTVVMFDRTNMGPSNLLLDKGRCRDNPRDLVLKHDCWAHSIEYTIATNKVRPLMLMTDSWCSSGAFDANGTLVQTGGFNDGARISRYFVPCSNASCDWVESPGLSADRWYASNQLLPDNRMIVVGGRKATSYEFLPRKPGEGAYEMPFLVQTTTRHLEENNLYPFLHLSSDGNLFIFANRDSILFDYKNNRVLKTFPRIPFGPRNYPSSGSSVMLPLSAANEFKRVEILICGGAPLHSFASATRKKFLRALRSCGRMVITDPSPKWVIDMMPAPRVLGDMLLLPNGEVLIINGAENGTAGWNNAMVPALAPYLYRPNELVGRRFTTLAATTIARVYHSTANVLPDGRILVGGSNTHYRYNLTVLPFPTEVRIEAYSPYYLNSSYDNFRPVITSLSSSSVAYGSTFAVRFNASDFKATNFQLNVYAPPFTTHSYGMNQRLLNLAISTPTRVSRTYATAVTAPPSAVAAPPGYYLLFVVNNGIPSIARWIHFS